MNNVFKTQTSSNWASVSTFGHKLIGYTFMSVTLAKHKRKVYVCQIEGSLIGNLNICPSGKIFWQ